MTDKTTLHVRIGERERTRQERLDRIEAAERGEPVEERHILNIERERDVARILSEVNLELLRTIAEQEPQSMRETAELVERDFKEVHRNLTELNELNLVEFEQDGRSKRPVVRFDEIQLELSYTSGHDEEQNHAVA
jgi:predicted transcriptional regulator